MRWRKPLTFEADNALIPFFRKALMIKSLLKKHATTLTLVAVVSLTAVLSANAQLIAYEGFDYGDNVWLGNTNAGGFGWGAAWCSGSQNVATNYATSLSYSDGTYTMMTSGGSAILGSSAPFAGTQQLQRNLNAAFTNRAAGSIWISFLYQNLTTDNAGRAGFRQAQLMLTKNATTNSNGTSLNNGTETVDVGSVNTYTAGLGDYMSLWGANPASMTYAQQSTLATPRGSGNNAVFVVMEIVTDGTAAADTVYVWFNPSLDRMPLVSTAISTNVWALEQFNGIRFAAGNANGSGTNAVIAFDELRVAYTFSDMMPLGLDTPEPATSVLAVLGSLILLTLKRRPR
jgi:hypothetical protein